MLTEPSQQQQPIGSTIREKEQDMLFRDKLEMLVRPRLQGRIPYYFIR